MYDVGEEIRVTHRGVEPDGGGSRKTRRGAVPRAAEGKSDVCEAAPKRVPEGSHMA